MKKIEIDTLYIAEKPTVARDIVEALGGKFQRNNGYYTQDNIVVTYCFGHLLTTQDPKNYNDSYKIWNIKDLPLNLYPIKYQFIEKSKEQAELICQFIKQAKIIVHAGDPDDEGQLLVDELLYFVNNQKPVKRLLINDNNINAVKKSLHNLQDNKKFFPIYQKALARQVGDLIYGLSMTRACTIQAQQKGFSGGVLSIGRVQTPMLGLIVNRYLQNKKHEAFFYYHLKAQVELNGIDFFAHNKEKFLEAKEIENIQKSVLENKGILTLIEQSIKKITPPLPFSLLTLQEFINRKHKITANRTLEITQELREQYKAITYNRSDCNYLSEEQYKESVEILKSLIPQIDAKYHIDKKIKSKAFNDDKITAHTAIIPTSNVPVDINQLTEEQKIVYKAIVNRYLIQFMQNFEYEELKGTINIEEYQFHFIENKILNLGFQSLVNDHQIKNSLVFEQLQKLQKDYIFDKYELIAEKKKTKPPALFTEADLMNALINIHNFVTDPKIKAVLKEKSNSSSGGIGTPATRSAILENLKNRGFLTVDKNKLIPTELGINLFNSLNSSITSANLTALWHTLFQEIEQNKLSIDDFVKQLKIDIQNLIQDLDTSNIHNDSGIKQFTCPQCQKILIQKAKFINCVYCNLIIWKTISGTTLTDEQIDDILSNKKSSSKIQFTSKSGKPFEAFLKLEDKKVNFSFE